MKKILSLITLLFLSFVSLSQTITTVAGGGIDVQFPTDESPALGSNMNPTGIAFSKSGELLIVGDNRLCKVDSFGMIFKIAGNGTNINTGDGQPAFYSQINSSKVSVNKNGEILLAGQYSTRIIDLSMVIKNNGLPLEPLPEVLTDIKCDTNGNIFTISGFMVVKKNLNWTRFAGTSNPHDPIWINFPTLADSCKIVPFGLGVDNYNNVYVADSFSKRILKISNNTISEYVGNGLPVLISGFYKSVAGSYTGDNGSATSAGINIGSTPTTIGMAFDKNNNLYFSDINNHAIRKVDYITGKITTILPVDTNELKYPSSLAFDKDDNLFVVDYGNKRVRKIDFSNGPNSIKDTKIDKNISVYPNPFQDILVLKSDLEINSIQIVNTLGQNVLSQKGNKSNSVTLDTKTLKSGLYFINTNNNIYKIVKQ